MLLRPGVRTGVSRGGFDSLERVQTFCEVSSRAQPHPAGSGVTEQSTVAQAVETIVRRYDGLRRLADSVSSIVGCEAADLTADQDPEDEAQQTGVVEVTWLVAG